jgi:hypothetical protein
MSKNTKARVVRLEKATTAHRTGALLVAADHEEAERLQARHPNALVIITGVPRSSRRDAP